MLREQPSCFAIDRTPSPRRAITRFSTACSWVSIDGTQKAVIVYQVGHFYFGEVGQYYFGVNTSSLNRMTGILLRGKISSLRTLNGFSVGYGGSLQLNWASLLYSSQRSSIL